MIHDWVALQCRTIVQVCCVFAVKTKSRGVRATNNTALPFFLSQHDLATFELNSITSAFTHITPFPTTCKGVHDPKSWKLFRLFPVFKRFTDQNNHS
jgi:hypothetical protein